MKIFRVPTNNNPIATAQGFITVPWMQFLSYVSTALSQFISSFVTGALSISTTGTSTDTMGTAVLVAGSVVVLNTQVSATSNIYLTAQIPGGTPGFLYISARTAGVSFTISSSNGADTSTVGWLLIQNIT